MAFWHIIMKLEVRRWHNQTKWERKGREGSSQREKGRVRLDRRMEKNIITEEANVWTNNPRHDDDDEWQLSVRQTENGLTFQRSDGQWEIRWRWAAQPTSRELWRILVHPDPPGRPSRGPPETTASPARTTHSAPTSSCNTGHTRSQHQLSGFIRLRTQVTHVLENPHP